MSDQDKPRVVISTTAEKAWAAATAAQRINGRYIKAGEYFLGPDNKEMPCNKELMVALLSALSAPDLITDEDVKQGACAREWFQGQLFNLLGGTLNEFMQKAAETAVKEEINVRMDFGMIACLPATWLRAAQKEHVRDVVNESTSQHVGTITEKITRMIKVLEVKPGVSFSGWLVTATDGANILRWCSSVQFSSGEAVRIQGKVKRHDNDRETGKPVTWLNYVKKLT
jgi:hypothetical protein